MGTTAVGGLIREWRTLRHMSQLALATEAEVSTRHLSFIETGKSNPSREMILVLASVLEVPLRERNTLLIAGGFAPAYRETALGDDAMRDVRRILELMLAKHDPYPALAVDRKGDVLMSNPAASALTEKMCLDHDAVLADGPPNVLRVLLHPRGVRHALMNWEEVARGIVGRAHRELRLEPDEGLQKVLDQVLAYPDVPKELHTFDATTDPPLYLPTRFAFGPMELSFISTITTIGTAVDITLQELRVEAFFPVDEATEMAVRALAG